MQTNPVIYTKYGCMHIQTFTCVPAYVYDYVDVLLDAFS